MELENMRETLEQHGQSMMAALILAAVLWVSGQVSSQGQDLAVVKSQIQAVAVTLDSAADRSYANQGAVISSAAKISALEMRVDRLESKQ